MTLKVKMRLMLLVGVVMIVLTTLIMLYGFKRTEELQQETHGRVLMKEPRTASFGDVPVGLTLGIGGDAAPAADRALFDDGLLVTIIGVEKRQCAGCAAGGEPMALLRLSGGKLGKGPDAIARISPSSLEWRDAGYLVTMLDIDPSGSVVFTVDSVK